DIGVRALVAVGVEVGAAAGGAARAREAGEESFDVGVGGGVAVAVEVGAAALLEGHRHIVDDHRVDGVAGLGVGGDHDLADGGGGDREGLGREGLGRCNSRLRNLVQRVVHAVQGL